MNHRLRHNKSDWVDVPRASRSGWQRIAAATHGFVTPGNAVTLLGLGLSIAGVIEVYTGALLTGFVLLVIGRIADLFDGFVAAATSTKSQIGEVFDASADKFIAAATLFVCIIKDVIPLAPVLIILAQSVTVAIFVTIAKLRGRELHASNVGKTAALFAWLLLAFFTLARLTSRHNAFIAALLAAVGCLLLIAFCVLAVDTIIGYARHALRAQPAQRYADDAWCLHQKAARIWRAYWRRKWAVALGVLILCMGLFSVYTLAASPYSSDSFVESPFTTSYQNGQVVLTQHYTPHIYRGWFASTIAYSEQAVTDMWIRLRSPKEPAGTVESIEASIHARRFDPSKPYVISGDQFQSLYLRNMSVFYQNLLNQHTALNDTDWHNRERIATQSLAYGLAATQQLKYPVTTLTPISPRGIIAVNFWSYPSDSMFGLMQMLQTLERNPGTKQVAVQLRHQYGSGLQAAYQNYLATVRDPKTGLVRKDIHLSSARDAVQRQSSFYDNVILWKTEQLASQFGFDSVSHDSLATLRQTILNKYWDNTNGHFIDDLTPGNEHSYSSDWLMVLPTGFLDPTNPDDLAKLERTSHYIDTIGVTKPLPIRYTADAGALHQTFFVKVFVGSYGNTAIWSYWGSLYTTLETELYQHTGKHIHAQHVETSLAAWRKVIVRDRGYPETLDAHGNMLKTLVYQSILRNGWITDFEANEYDWSQAANIKQ